MSDERGLVGRAAITIMVLILVGGIVAIDGSSILFTKLQLSDTAEVAASAAADAYEGSHDQNAAVRAAIDAVEDRDSDAQVTAFDVSGGAVTVTVRKVASTLVARRWEPLRKLAIVTSTATSSV
jgi:uncharacterized membrane protein